MPANNWRHWGADRRNRGQLDNRLQVGDAVIRAVYRILLRWAQTP